MNKFINYMLLILLSLTANTYGQQSGRSRIKDLDPKIKSLKVGDKVPDILIVKIINSNNKCAKISDFRNQLLILDFWDTYCGSCIEALPKLNAMQRKFGTKIKILPVTWQRETEVINFFKENKFLKSQTPAFNLPCVVEDRILASYFRHQMISHEVWIYKGVVKAITTPEYVNAENIQLVLNEKSIDWPIKNDAVDFDLNKPLMRLDAADQYNQKGGFFSYSVLTGQRNGLNYTGGINITRDSLTGLSRLALFNKPILDAYSILLFNSDSIRKEFILGPGRVILEVKEPLKYAYNPKAGLQDKWQREHEICYEWVYSSPKKDKELIKSAIKDLDNRLGVRGRWEKRPVKCLVFVKTDKKLDFTHIPDLSKIEGNQVTSISALQLLTFDYSGKYPPTIDETGYTGKVYLGKHDDSIEGFRKELQKNGFDLIEAEREIDVMVITENDWKKP